MHRYFLALTALIAASGCHTFQPASVDVLAPGQTVRARVTGAFSDTLSTMLTRADAREFEGVVVESTGSSTFLDIPVEQGFEPGMRHQTLSQRVEIPDAAFVEIEIKELSRGRTLAAAGLAGAVIGAIVIHQLNKDTGGDNRPGTGGPQEAVISLGFPAIPLLGAGRLTGR